MLHYTVYVAFRFQSTLLNPLYYEYHVIIDYTFIFFVLPMPLLQVEEKALEPVSPARPSVTFSREVESDIPGPALLVSLAYLKTSEKLTVIVMKAKNLKPIGKNKKPGEWPSRLS